MERSEPDDGAWDDPLDLGMPGEPEYPAAPIPAHERVWRHPSELGHAAWVQSERSTGLGRGLLVTSGAIGCILGLAVVWLMVPSPGNAPSADPTVARSDLAVAPTDLVSLASTTLATRVEAVATPMPTLPLTSAAPVLVETVTPPSRPPETAPQDTDVPPSSVATFTLPAEDLPTNTVWLKSSVEGAASAVAVVVGDSPYLMTTANAVGPVESVRVLLASGGVASAPVVSIDASFAYIEPDESLATFGFGEAAVAEPGEDLTVLADEQIVFVYGDDTLTTVDPASVAEGTPVVNERGALVGLCTVASGAIELVPIQDAIPAATVPPTTASTVPPSAPSTTPTTPGTATTTPSSTSATSATSQPTTAPSSTASPSTTVEPSTSVAPAASPAASTTSVPSTSASPSTASPSTTVASSTTTSAVATTTTVASTTTVAAQAKRVWLGVRLAGTQSAAPLTITSVVPESPASAAGITAGDEILAVDDVAVATLDELSALVQSHEAGDTIVLTLLSPSKGTVPRTERDVSVVLGQPPREL